MTYIAGTHGLSGLGIPDDDPRITCDTCGLIYRVLAGSHAPPKWFLDGKAPAGWRIDRETGHRLDYCPCCK